MKKFILFTASLCYSVLLMGQAKKPTIMVVPSDNWCIQNNFVIEYQESDKTLILPDYKAALQNSSDLLMSISKINELMAERGFPLKNLETELKIIEQESAEDAMMQNREGASVAESPIDKLKKTAKADIWMQLTFTVNNIGPKKSLSFALQGIDVYTGKQVAGASGTGAPSFTSEVALLVNEAILAHIETFNASLQVHFDDLLANGREINTRVQTWDDFEYGLETEYDGLELSGIIENWMVENTVQGRFNITDVTENYMRFEQVRIPLTETYGDGKIRQIDARRWMNGLRKHLKDKYDIESKITTKGLGEARLIIGGK